MVDNISTVLVSNIKENKDTREERETKPLEISNVSGTVCTKQIINIRK